MEFEKRERKMVKYLIFGNGFLGQYLKDNLKDSVIYIEKVDGIINPRIAIQDVKPDVVINCIGKTGSPNVDWCETNKLETFESNVLVPLWLARACKKEGVHFINIGTGCIFQSDTPIDDFFKPNYDGSFYSRTKRMVEDILTDEHPEYTTLRIRMPINNTKVPKNLLSKIDRFTKVTDIPNSVTFMSDIVRAIKFSVKQNMCGPINVVHPQPTSIENIKSKLGGDYNIVKQEDLAIGSRSNTIMIPKLLLDAGFTFEPFEKMLEEAVNGYKSANSRNV